jgi:NAD(P)H-hydrate epimerase
VTLPGWLDPLLDAERMRATDRWAIDERGVPSLDLMERAGAGLAELVDGTVPEGRLAVVCGKGNNGGDGLVAARLLRESGREVTVLALAGLEESTGDARENLLRLPDPPPEPFRPPLLEGCAGVVDAILGTGSSGAPRGPAAEAIAAIVNHAAPAVAADIPSGVDASTGEVPGEAVRATATATFHAAKPGLWINPGKRHAGEVDVIDIGIPRDAPVQADIGLIDSAVRALVPGREAGSTKFTSGHVLVAGGSVGLTGAPSLASDAAMRAGAGYVTACVPASLNLVFEARLLEVMTVPLGDDQDGSLLEAAAERVLELAERRGGALVLGPGLGRRDGAASFARRLAAQAPVALVLDADGLNAHAGQLESLTGRPSAAVLTPHAGELGRLLELDSAEVDAHRLARVREAASRAQAIVVLKGDDTLVAAPDGRVGVSRGGSRALATAGTGDVLSGVVGAMLAKGLDPFAAACAAVWIHTRAGVLAAERRPAEGVIASDVIAELPWALVE